MSRRLVELLLSSKFKDRRHVTHAERILQTLINNAISGDIQAIKLIVYMVEGPTSQRKNIDLNARPPVPEITAEMTPREAQELFERAKQESE
jgi:hypothetical protein